MNPARVFGVCVFVGTEIALADQLGFLEKALAHGCRLVMTSLHLPEMDLDRAAAECRTIAERTRSAGAWFVADVAKWTLRRLAAEPADLRPLAMLGLDAVRPDYGFTADELAAIAAGRDAPRLALNATDTPDALLADLAARGCPLAGTWAIHNYYPRPETGISVSRVQAAGAGLRRHAIRVAAFAASAHRRRGPVFAGLPTIEDLRDAPCAHAAEVLFAAHAVDAVVLGDPSLDDGELAALRHVVLRDWVEIGAEVAGAPAAPERGIMENVHTCWGISDYVVRTGNPAVASAHPAITPRGTESRPAYTVTIDNERYARFAGTLHIVRRDLGPDERVNVVGRVPVPDRVLVDLLEAGDRFRLVWDR